MTLRKKFHRYLLDHPFVNPYGFNPTRFYQNLTVNSRMKPSFLVIGYAKSGTTSLFHYLSQHPQICQPTLKEIQYFAQSYWRGKKWYQSHFPTRKKNCITFEASPDYIWYPNSLRRIHNEFPNMKLILLLRNPIDRAYSHYNHKRTENRDSMDTFEKAIDEDQERYDFILKNSETLRAYDIFPAPYLSIGKYSRDLKNCYNIFTKNQVLVIKSEELKINPSDTLNKIFEFLNLPNTEVNFVKKNVRKYEQMNIKTRNMLRDYYNSSNQELENMLNIKLDWK